MARKCSSAPLRRRLAPLRRRLALLSLLLLSLLSLLLLLTLLLLPRRLRLRRGCFDPRAAGLARALLLIQLARAHLRARPELVLSLDDEPLTWLEPLGDDGDVA